MPILIPYTKDTVLQTGDILQTASVVPFIKHYAIFYYDKDGKPTVADNSFLSGKLDTFPEDGYKAMRTITGIIRNENTINLTNQHIQQKVEEGKKKNYQFFAFNCEDFVRSVCGCTFGTDQRIAYLVAFFFILVFIIIFIKSRQ